MSRVWDRFLTERDQQVLAAAGYGVRAGFGKRPLLLVIDVTYGFTGDRPEPILESIRRWPNSCGEESWKAVSRIAELSEVFRAKRLPVIYSAGTSREDKWDAGSWAWKNSRVEETAPPDSNRRGEDDIVDELAPQEQDIVIRKQKPSVFFGTNLMSYINLLGCDSLVMTGCTTSGCVRATVIDAFSYNLRSIVVEDACFDRGEASHAVTLFDLHCKYADVISSEEVIGHARALSNELFPNLPGSDTGRRQSS